MLEMEAERHPGKPLGAMARLEAEASLRGEPEDDTDPEVACDAAIGLIVKDIARLGRVKVVRGNDVNRGTLLATYARTLSTISRDRKRPGGGKDDLGTKSMEELVEMAKGIPELRELLEAGR